MVYNTLVNSRWLFSSFMVKGVHVLQYMTKGYNGKADDPLRSSKSNIVVLLNINMEVFAS